MPEVRAAHAEAWLVTHAKIAARKKKEMDEHEEEYKRRQKTERDAKDAKLVAALDLVVNINKKEMAMKAKAEQNRTDREEKEKANTEGNGDNMQNADPHAAHTNAMLALVTDYNAAKDLCRERRKKQIQEEIEIYEADKKMIDGDKKEDHNAKYGNVDTENKKHMTKGDEVDNNVVKKDGNDTSQEESKEQVKGNDNNNGNTMQQSRKKKKKNKKKPKHQTAEEDNTEGSVCVPMTCHFASIF